MNKRPPKIKYYLNIAREVARRSTCLRRHFGTIIVKEGQIIATGYTGAPRGAPNCIDKSLMILGLYEGVPQTKRWYYSQALPDKITIFKNSIERMACSEDEIKKIVKNTVWHEIAHHFGMDERKIREVENFRKNIAN
jgi:hypothetical protein